MDKDLTPQKAITAIKQAEQVGDQQDVLRSSEGQGHSGTTDLYAIRTDAHISRKDITCHVCSKTGHFRNVCRSSVGKPSRAVPLMTSHGMLQMFLDVL